MPVPKAIQDVVGKKEITKSFKTKDKKRAEKLYPEYLSQVQQVFEHAYAKLKTGEQAKLAGFNPLNSVAKWHHQRRSEIMARTKAMFKDEREIEDYKYRLRSELVELSSHNPNRRYRFVERAAHDILAEQGYEFDKTTGQPEFDTTDSRYHDLFEHLITSMIELREIELSRLGEPIQFTPNGGVFRSVQVAEAATETSRTPVSKLIAHFMDVKGNAGKPKTVADRKAAFEYLLRSVGPDFYVENLTRDHFVAIRDVLKAYPKNANKLKALKSLSLSERSLFAQQHGLPLMSKQNANKVIARLKSLMEFAVSTGLIERNPCLEIEFQISSSEKQENEMRPFSVSDLNKLFQSEAFEHSYPKGPAMFWAPLIALFHGFRMEEILLLTLKEVKSEAGIRYFDLTNFSLDDLKNANALRRVSIHEELSSLGFEDYLLTCKNNKGQRLFPELNRGAGQDTSYRKGFSQKFTRYRKEIGLNSKGVVFHSFRRNFSIACTNGKIPLDVENALAGWALKGGQGGTYKKAKDIGLEVLKEMMDRVSYPELDLSHLYTQT